MAFGPQILFVCPLGWLPSGQGNWKGALKYMEKPTGINKKSMKYSWIPAQEIFLIFSLKISSNFREILTKI